MAIYSKKGKDPTEVALSAIQDALNIRDADVKPAPSAGPAATAPAVETPSEARRRAPRAPAREIPLDAPPMAPTRDARDDRDIVQAANDDQESIGQILQSLQRRSSPTPFIIASLFAAIWTVGLIALIWSGQVGRFAGEAGYLATMILVAGAYGAPIIFFYALGIMVARLTELRIVS